MQDAPDAITSVLAGAFDGVNYTAGLTSDPFLQDVLEQIQANPDPTTWPALPTIGGANDVAIMSGNGVQVVHFNEDGEVSAQSPAAAAQGGPGQLGGSASLQASSVSYTADLTSADAFLQDVLELLQGNLDPESWPPIASISGAQNVVAFSGAGVQTLHFDADGTVSNVTPLPTGGGPGFQQGSADLWFGA